MMNIKKFSDIPLEWVALDTETYKGKAFLLSTPNGVHELKTFFDFVNVLFSYPSSTRFIFYNLDYDVAALLALLGQRIVEDIYVDRAVKLKSENGDTVSVRYHKHKVFEINRNRHVRKCFDLLPFFQTKLEKVSQQYLGVGKCELPEGIISNLSPTVYHANKTLIDEYAIRDAKLLQDLTNRFLTSLQSVGFSGASLYSPGYLAKTYLKMKNILPTKLLESDEKEIVRGYFGGRTEIVKRGFCPDWYVYDITSAYPYAITQLPDLLHATITRSREPESEWSISRVRIKETIPAFAHLLPYKTGDNLLIYPMLTDMSTTATSIELSRLPKNSFRYLETFNLWCENKNPLSGIVLDLFRERQSASEPMNKVIFKLILNSLYGVFAEGIRKYKTLSLPESYKLLRTHEKQMAFESFVSICLQSCKHASEWYLKKCRCPVCKAVRKTAYLDRMTMPLQTRRVLEFDDEFFTRTDEPGKFRNMLMASFITAFTRCQVYDKIREADSAFVASFTDSVITEKPLALSDKVGLGEWELKYHGPGIMIASGIYENVNTVDAIESVRTRGFRLPTGERWATFLPTVKGQVATVREKRRVTAGQVVTSYRKYSHFNEIRDTDHELDLNCDRKRVWDKDFRNGQDVLDNWISSQALTIPQKKT